jgi:hypothetical protein
MHQNLCQGHRATSIAKKIVATGIPSVFPAEVLNKDIGELMEMQHLLKNSKYSELWGKSYTKELSHLAQEGIPETNRTDTICIHKI